MQILLINDVLYGILAGAYSTVARIYSIMLDLAGVTSKDRTLELGVIGSFSNITTAIYTIAGIFMLFRVTIAMINMLINPDMVSDRNAGAGKVLTRVITSVAMLIIFIPNGWVFGDNGILNRLEQGLLAEDGLINRIIPASITENDTNNSSSTNSSAGSNTNSAAADVGNTITEGANTVREIAENAVNSTQSTSANYKKNIFVEDVYAAGETINCYYFYKEANTINTTGSTFGGVTENAQQAVANTKYKYNATKGLFHIKFYNQSTTNTSSTGRKQLCTKWSGLNIFSKTAATNCDKYSYEIIVDDSSESKPLYKSNLPSSSLYLIGSHFANGWKNTCPHIIDGGTAYYEAKTGKTDSYKTVTSGIVGGWHSHEAMQKVIKDETTVTGNDDDKKQATEKLGVQTLSDAVDSAVSANASVNLLEGVNPKAIGFGQNTMGSFLQCSEGNNDQCEGLIANSLTTTTGNDAIVSALDAKPAVMVMDFMIGLIAAVGIAIWLLIMCVDVIVRRFKLILLQVIAPIPIISYSDPKDKMFGQWAKMYLTVYADLFLKLIAIGFATALLENIRDTLSGKGLLVFFYIVAILVFAKVLPSLLSELFGFKMGNSFKDITGMGKAALGFGVGAAIGGTAGLISGIETGASGRKNAIGRIAGGAAGALKGTTRGVLRGAGSGSKGDVFGGSKSTVAANYRDLDAREDGLTGMDRFFGGVRNAVGFNSTERFDRQVKQKEGLREAISSIQSGIGDVDKMLEGTNIMKDLAVRRQNGEITNEAYMQAKKNLAKQFDAGKKEGDIFVQGIGGMHFDEAGFKKGYDSAKERLDVTLNNIKSNKPLADALQSIKYDDGKGGLANIQLDAPNSTFDEYDKIKSSSFAPDSMLANDIANIKANPEYRKAQTIDQYSGKSGNK